MSKKKSLYEAMMELRKEAEELFNGIIEMLKIRKILDKLIK